MKRPIRIISTPPKVILIGQSRMIPEGIQEYFEYRKLEWNSEAANSDLPSGLIEFGGRVCYESFHNPKNDTPGDYIARTCIGKKHWSIARHVQMNFAVASLPRHSLAELTRHHVGVSYSVRSSRYVDTYLEFVIPPAARGYINLEAIYKTMARDQAEEYEDALSMMEKFTKKERTEAARALLGGNFTCDLEMSANIEALINIINARRYEGADKSMQEFAEALLDAALTTDDEELRFVIAKAVGAE